jgi:transposase-like protein
MAQHFLLSAQARTLSLRSIYQGGEEAAYKRFCAIRWADTDGEPVCPRCGCVDAYEIATRRRFKCKACWHQFSVTSGTIFASRKMAFTDLLAAICIFVNAVKGLSALQLSRDLDCQYKTAFVLAHKLREALKGEIDGHELCGTVEIDGQYHGGHIRPANLKEDRGPRTCCAPKPSFTPTKPPIGMRCTPAGQRIGSTTPKPTASMASAPIRWRAISAGSVA